MKSRLSPLVLILMLTACPLSTITVKNETRWKWSQAEIEAMAFRLWDQANVDLIVRLLPPNSPLFNIDGTKGEFVHGPGRTDEIRIVYEGCLSETSFAHELIHWRSTNVYDEGDSDHSSIDWLLEDILNAEFPCGPREPLPPTPVNLSEIEILGKDGAYRP